MRPAATSWRARGALAALVAGYGAVVVVSAAPDSPLRPPLPPGVTILPPLVRTATAIGLDRVGRSGLIVLAVCLLAALVGAFAVLLVEALRGRVGTTAVAVCGLVALTLVVVAPVLLSRDVYSYATYGRMVSLHGMNPYVRSPSAVAGDPFFRVISPEWRHTRSVYGPAFTLLSVALSGASPGADLLAFKVLAGLAAGGAAWLAGSAAGRWGRPELGAAAIALVVLNPVVVIHTVGGGHNDALVALAVAGAAWLAAGWRPVAAPPDAGWRATPSALGPRGEAIAAVLATAALVKIVAAIPLAVFAWAALRASASGRQRVRTLVDAGVVAGGLTLVLVWPFGLHALTAVANLASRQGWASGARLVARGAEALGRSFGGSTAASAMRSTIYAAFLLLFVALLWKVVRRLDPRALPAAWGAALMLFALAAPYLLPWYAAWFLPVLVFVEDRILLWAGVALSLLLALSGVPAEPGSTPAAWHAMVLAVHYGEAPVMLGLLGVVAARILRRPS